MGGSALSVSTRRLVSQDFHILASRLSRSLSETLAGARVMPIPAYHAKADFGDLDLIVEWAAPRLPNDPVPESLLRWSKVGRAREQVVSGHVISLDWRTEEQEESVAFQVDLILTAPEHVDTSLAYFSYNDMSNFIGRVAHRMGFIYGHKGLLLPLTDGPEKFAQIEVSRDPPKILKFLGYDPDRFAQGFETLPDIFAYVASGAYFDPNLFGKEQNNAARRQAIKRPTHRLFHEWLQMTQPPARHAWAKITDGDGRLREQKHFLKMAQTRFPHVLDRVDAAWKHRALAQAQSQADAQTLARLNGHRVGEWTGLKGSDLGRLITQLRTELGTPSQAAQWLSSRTDDDLKTWVLSQQEAFRPTSLPRRPSP